MKTRRYVPTKINLLLAAVLSLALLAAPTSTKANIVGYINLSVLPGDNLIANQLVAGDMTINSVLTNGVADGAQFRKWNAGLNTFSPVSTYFTELNAWDINLSFGLGEGGVLSAMSPFVCTLVGEVGTNLNSGGPPRVINWNPNYADGLHLISCPVPFGDAKFNEVVGRAPLFGESVTRLNEANQTYFTTTFDGIEWDNGAPTLGVGESAYYNLGPVIVPEPSTLALCLGGSVCALAVRTRRKG